MSTVRRIPELFNDKKTPQKKFFNSGMRYYQELKETPSSLDKVGRIGYSPYRAVGAGRKDGAPALLSKKESKKPNC